ncbi:tRNA (cytosine-5-)-methyltransferase-like [Tropilaelaps mercedesae]|uniref:tRNA (Cytosine-5-)-methyltransferase-like n=1 Tax=Tropilaelaps mercedesae TaxID=418985 RepID=A0A1V9X3F5_9ACAR|nr:tRNA (cytosine-5-)-methyltransferase-like [Tropilaelaps mercedesae]
MKGTGSVLASCPREDVDAAYSAPQDQRPARIRALGLRLFSPREVASLMCFPSSFHFPSETTMRQSYHLLGNSVNIRVISLLMRFMFNAVNLQDFEAQ